MRAVVFFFLGLPALCAMPALAADCPMERAVYVEDEQASELRFTASDNSESSPVTHGFRLVAGAAEADGQVYYDPEVERPVAMVMKGCPEGDVTGADLAACTIWKGIIYGIDKGGHADLLPPEGAAAPDRLLLPGFGPAVAASSFGQTLKGMPWDVFSYKECAP